MKSRFLSTHRLGPALSACLVASAVWGSGCYVYDDEMLGRPVEPGVGDHHVDAAGVDVPAWESATPSTMDGAVDSAITADAGTPDAAADVDDHNDSVNDGNVRDGAANDSDSTAIDAPTRSDASLDSRDAEASTPPADAPRIDSANIDTVVIDVPHLADADATTIDTRADVDAGDTPPPTFRVLRIGDGVSSLTTASSRAFLEERTLDGALVGSPLALPIAAIGNQSPCTFAGSATAEGSLSLSVDGRFLTIAGYASPPDVDSIPSSNAARVVARIDSAGVIDTSTLISDAFGRGNVRGATTLDGTGFWVSGTGGPAGGIWYAPFGGGTCAHIVASPDNIRWLQVVAGQLYASSGASPTTNVFTVGAGTPTTGVQNIASLAGMPSTGMSPYAFAFFDHDVAVGGVDTLYLADDRAPTSDGSAGGVQKWTSDGTNWKRVATFSDLGGGALTSFRGLAAIDRGSDVVIVASSAENDANRLVVFVDDGNANPVGNVIATSSAATVFRGIALSPHR